MAGPEVDASTSAVVPPPTSENIRAALRLGWDLSVPADEIPPVSVAARLATLQTLIGHAQPIEALLVTDLTNIRALSGFTGSAAKLLLTASSATLITDARYHERAVEELEGAGCTAEVLVRRTAGEQLVAVSELLRAQNVTNLGLEASAISWSAQQQLAEALPDVALTPTQNMVERLRRTKSPVEVALTARAAAIADQALLKVLPSLKNGLTEREFQRGLDDAMVQLGADEVSFDTIVASGPNASRPHHEPGTRVIEQGDQVIIDFGALVRGYHSDMTRTVHIGEPSPEQQRHFDVVLAAHDAGAAAIGAGLHCIDVDRAARVVCEQAGWGDEFVHGLGHGTGLVIHELPWLGTSSRNEMAVGDLVTIEPGVYLPGVGGVRIEDLYVLTNDGPIAITRAPVALSV